jgi:hypothetical protein
MSVSERRTLMVIFGLILFVIAGAFWLWAPDAPGTKVTEATSKSKSTVGVHQHTPGASQKNSRTITTTRTGPTTKTTTTSPTRSESIILALLGIGAVLVVAGSGLVKTVSGGGVSVTMADAVQANADAVQTNSDALKALRDLVDKRIEELAVIMTDMQKRIAALEKGPPP